ncbi:MAG: hypothetical protein K2Y32_13355 [Candidatus Obscuribacterales bacterium]|nr:hypothetical protein [Candidatus Obscuribacterales bacterium]
MKRATGLTLIALATTVIGMGTSMGCAPHASAQGYDTSGLMPTNRDMGYISPNFGQANNSIGAKGDIDRGSYETGAGPSDYRQYNKRESSFSGKQLSNGDYGQASGRSLNSPIHPFGLELPYASTGGLAPVFGYGSQNTGAPRFTSVLDLPVTTILPGGGHISVVPSTGQVVSRIGGVRGGMTVGADGISSGAIGNGSGFGGTFGSGGGTVGGTIPGLGTFGNSGF